MDRSHRALPFGNTNHNLNRYNDLHKPIQDDEGKYPDVTEQCDSGIESYNSYQSYDQSISTEFASLSVDGSAPPNKTIDTIASLNMDDMGYSSIPPSTEDSDLIKPEPQPAVEEVPINAKALFGPDIEGDTLLQLAIIQQKVDLAFDIIQYCTDPRFLNFANANQQTALHLAVATDQPQLTRGLVAYGADFRCKDKQGNTPLHLACELGLSTQVDMLTEELDDDENPGYQRLQFPQNVNERNYSGFSPLHLAVLNKHTDVIHKLIHRLKCDVNAMDLKSGRTALHHSVECDYAEITNLLVKAEANVNALTYDECSPLHLAASRGFKRQAEILLHNNADLYLITRDDYDVFELSAHSKCRRMTAYLRKKEEEQRQKNKAHHYRGLN